MSFRIGTVECKCANVMGMPTDSGHCMVCDEKKSFWGEKTYSRLEEWAKEHSKLHQPADPDAREDNAVEVRMAQAAVEGDEAKLADALERLQSEELDLQAVLNAVHVPADAGEYEEGLRKIMARIPDGWGRWISCGPGWYPILVKLDEELAELDPDYAVCQLKEKYGGLRYYFSTTKGQYPAMDKLIAEAEKQCEQTCEQCGQPAVLSVRGGWFKTLCQTCRTTLEYEIYEREEE